MAGRELARERDAAGVTGPGAGPADPAARERRRDVVPVLAAAAAAALVLGVWCADLRLRSNHYGQDAAIYAMNAERLARGHLDALFPSIAAPGLPFVLAVLGRAGIPVTFSHRLLALAGHLALCAAAGHAAHRGASAAGLRSRPAWIAAAVAAAGFGLIPSNVIYGTMPLTDHLSLAAAVIAGLAAVSAPPDGRLALRIGCLAAGAYLLRYVSVLMFAPAVAILVFRTARAGGFAGLRRTLVPLAAPPLAAVLIVVAGFLASGGRVSAGIDVQMRANSLYAERCEASDVMRRGSPRSFAQIHEDGTLGAFRADPAAEDAGNCYRWGAEDAFRSEDAAGGRFLRNILGPRAWSDLAGLVARGIGAVPLAAAIIALILLPPAIRRPLLGSWAALVAGAAIALAGGFAAYFGEARYLWPLTLPAVAALAVVPAVATIRGCGLRALTAAAVAGIGLVTLFFESARGDAALAFGRGRREEADIDRSVAAALAGAVQAAGETATVAATSPGVVLATGARWLPLPLTGADPRSVPDAAGAEALVESVGSALLRGRATIALVTRRDATMDPAGAGRLFRDEARPRWAEFASEIRGPDGSPEARVLVLRFTGGR